MLLKISILFTCAFLSCTTFPKLSGMYISAAGDTISINKNAKIKMTKPGHDEGVLLFKQEKRKLKFKTTWYHHHLFFKNPHKIYFNVIKNVNDTLLINPSTKWSKLLFENRDSIFFRKTRVNVAVIELQ